MSFKDFATFLKNYRDVDFYKVIYPKIKEAIRITLDAFWARVQKLTNNEKCLKEKILN